MLEVGMKAPDFTLCNEEGKEYSLSDFKGKKVILYFYPKDNTAGCSAQACGFASNYPLFKEKGAEVIGISKDSQKSHMNFKTKYDLPFILLSDPTLEVINLYDVYKEKMMYGKKVMGVVRTTYLIDEEGVIIKALDKVKAKDNPQQMLDML